jgi:hypothetical protein
MAALHYCDLPNWAPASAGVGCSGGCRPSLFPRERGGPGAKGVIARNPGPPRTRGNGFGLMWGISPPNKTGGDQTTRYAADHVPPADPRTRPPPSGHHESPPFSRPTNRHDPHRRRRPLCNPLRQDQRQAHRRATQTRLSRPRQFRDWRLHPRPDRRRRQPRARDRRQPDPIRAGDQDLPPRREGRHRRSPRDLSRPARRATRREAAPSLYSLWRGQFRRHCRSRRPGTRARSAVPHVPNTRETPPDAPPFLRA